MYTPKYYRLLLPPLLALLAPSGPAAAGVVRSVVELFTSQGCSSCPPADKVLSELAHDPSVLAVSLPIDYWDYIGWRDTLASPVFTARQKAYAAAGGDNRVYTPQAVVNGLKDAVGSDRAAIDKAAETTRATAGVMAAPLEVAVEGAAIKVSVGDGLPGSPQEAGVYLLALQRSQSVTVRRGENAGATLTYSNVVRAIIKIGDWHGEKQAFSADEALAHVDGADSFAIIVQAGRRSQPGAILAGWAG